MSDVLTLLGLALPVALPAPEVEALAAVDERAEADLTSPLGLLDDGVSVWLLLSR